MLIVIKYEFYKMVNSDSVKISDFLVVNLYNIFH